MAKRTRLQLLFTVFAFALTIIFANWRKDSFMFEKYARQISAYLSEQSSEATSWLENVRQPLSDILAGRVSIGFTDAPLLHPDVLAAQQFTIFLTDQRDSIIFWNNNKSLPTATFFSLKEQVAAPRLIQLPTGYFLTWQQPFEEFRAYVLVPVVFQNFNAGTTEYFPANHSIPTAIAVQPGAGEFSIEVDGQKLGHLVATQPVRYPKLQWLTLFMGLFSVFLLFRLVNRFSMWVAENRGSALGSAAFLVPIGIGLWCFNVLDVPAHFEGLGLFAKKFSNSSLGDSLGEWLLYIGVMLWLMVFFHREFKAKDWGQLPDAFRIGLGVAFNSSLMACVVMVVILFKQLIFDSYLVFDFDNILNVDRYSLVAIFGITLLLAGLFLFSHRMMLTVSKIDLNAYQRMLSTVIAGAFTYFICHQLGDEIKIHPSAIVSFSFVYVVAFDYFIGRDNPGFGWIVSWLFIFSFFSAILLYYHNQKKDYDKRLNYAQQLTIPQDVFAEPKFDSLQKILLADSQFDKFIPPTYFYGGRRDLLDFIAQKTVQFPYLFQHYKAYVQVFQEQEAVFDHPKSDTLQVVLKDWEGATMLEGNPSIRRKFDEKGNIVYLMYRRAFREGNTNFPVDAYIYFYPDLPNPTKLYSALFYRTAFRNLNDLNRYEFAIFKNGREITSFSGANQLTTNTEIVLPDAGKAVEKDTPGNIRTTVFFTNEIGYSAAVSRYIGGKFKYTYLFSALFTLLSMLMMLLGLVNTRLRILPEYYQFYISTKGSLAKRIQIWTVALIVATFLVVGFFSYRTFKSSAEAGDYKKFTYRNASMLNHLNEVTATLSPNPKLLKEKLPQLIGPIANSFSTDVNLYSATGDLLFTSQTKLEQIGVLSAKMNASPFVKLSSKNYLSVYENEQLGGHIYPVSYSTLLNSEKQILGFLAVPFYRDDNNISPEISDFMGILATIYVFLLFVAGSVAFRVAKNIIKPIRLITDTIIQLRLEDQNEPLKYEGDGQDELSELIDEYNRMVERLSESRRQLVKFERDAAWRTMASQVAHDIKNGLSPMRLTTQQLERLTSSEDTERIKNYLRTAIGRLIQQIDSLAYIASEFSMLSKLEIGERVEVSFSSMVDTVFGMHAYSETIDYQIDIPDEEIFILADRGHLMRVLNNLVINAGQAIPSDRRGLIRVKLFLKNNDQKVVLKVSDNGTGVPEEVIPRLFEPNFTTKTTGSGLGLAISKRIVEAHDGEIYFETKQDVGTDFYVVLPVHRVV